MKSCCQNQVMQSNNYSTGIIALTVIEEFNVG